MANRLKARLALALLLSIGIAALWFVHGWLKAPLVASDAYQYLDAASSVASGGCLCTRVAHFDEQVATGRLPVALTHFPPGYPLLIAALSRLGMSLETAGYVISAAGFLLTIWLIWNIAEMLGGSLLVTSIFVLVWATHHAALVYGSTVVTESVFTTVFTGLAALVIHDLKSDGKHPQLLLGIGGLAGASYFIRYAGLFLIPPTLLYILWRWRRNRTSLWWAVAGVLAVCAFMVPIQVRNIIYMGSWQGMLVSAVSHSPGQALFLSIAALQHLIMGEYPLFSLTGWTIFLAFCVFSVCGLAFHEWRRGARARTGEFLSRTLAWLAVFVVVYVTGIILAKVSMANMNMAAQDLVRYYLPLYPLLLACLAGFVSRIRPVGVRFAACLTALTILVAHSLSFAGQPGRPLYRVIEGSLQEEVYPGESMRQWILDHVPAETAVVSEEGQALRYVLPRPVTSIVEPPEFSNRAADGRAFRDLMRRYKSRYLLLFPTIRLSQNSLPFLQDLVLGKGPDWLKPSVRTQDVVVYECEACTK